MLTIWFTGEIAEPWITVELGQLLDTRLHMVLMMRVSSRNWYKSSFKYAWHASTLIIRMDLGRQKDGNGKLVNWWDNTTLHRFLERAQCFINQYNGLVVSEVNATVITHTQRSRNSLYKDIFIDWNPSISQVNGINTQGENIADNGAIYQAFRAYNKYKERHGEEQWLPGLNYSPDQLFFIGYGQKWCESITKEALYNQIKTGAHSPSKFRSNAVLQNFEEFAKIWDCPRPKQRCRIW